MLTTNSGNANPDDQPQHVVKMLKGTYVRSVGRDVLTDEVVTISSNDYRFLKPYQFCVDHVEDEVAAAPKPAPVAEEVVVKTAPEVTVEDTTKPKVEGKRK